MSNQGEEHQIECEKKAVDKYKTEACMRVMCEFRTEPSYQLMLKDSILFVDLEQRVLKALGCKL